MSKVPNPALWNDGEPANLRAAAMDALDWLDVLVKQAAYIRMPREDVRRLLACRAALGRQLRTHGVTGLGDGAERRVEAVIEKLRNCKNGCGPFGQCKAAMQGKPGECAGCHVAGVLGRQTTEEKNQ